MSHNTKEKTAARELQTRLGCSYSTALKQVRDAEAARRREILQLPPTLHPVPPEIVAELLDSRWATIPAYEGPTVNHDDVKACITGTGEGEK